MSSSDIPLRTVPLRQEHSGDSSHGGGKPDEKAKKGHIFNRQTQQVEPEKPREFPTELGNLVDADASKVRQEASFASDTMDRYRSFLDSYTNTLVGMNGEVFKANPNAVLDRQLLDLLGIDQASGKAGLKGLDTKIEEFLTVDDNKVFATKLLEHSAYWDYAPQGLQTNITDSSTPAASKAKEVSFERGKGWLKKALSPLKSIGGVGAVGMTGYVAVTGASLVAAVPVGMVLTGGAIIGATKVDWKRAMAEGARFTKNVDIGLLTRMQTDPEMRAYAIALKGIDPSEVRIDSEGNATSSNVDTLRAMDKARRDGDYAVKTREAFFTDIGVDPSRIPLKTERNIDIRYRELVSTVSDQWGQDGKNECYLRADCKPTGVGVVPDSADARKRLDAMRELHKQWSAKTLGGHKIGVLRRPISSANTPYDYMTAASQIGWLPAGMEIELDPVELSLFLKDAKRRGGLDAPVVPSAHAAAFTEQNRIKAAGNLAEARLIEERAVGGLPAPTTEEIAKVRVAAIAKVVSQKEENYLKDIPAIDPKDLTTEVAHRAALHAREVKKEELASLRMRATQDVLVELSLSQVAEKQEGAARTRVTTIEQDTQKAMDRFSSDQGRLQDEQQRIIDPLTAATTALDETRKKAEDEFGIPKSDDVAEAAAGKLARGSDLMRSSDRREVGIIGARFEADQRANAKGLQEDSEQLNQAEARKRAVEDAIRDLSHKRRGVALPDLVTEAEGEILRLSAELQDPRDPTKGLLPALNNLLIKSENQIREDARSAYLLSIGGAPNAVQKKVAERRGDEAVDSHNKSIERYKEIISPHQSLISGLDQSLENLGDAQTAYARANAEIDAKAARRVELAARKKARDKVIRPGDSSSIQPNELRGQPLSQLAHRLLEPPYSMPVETVENQRELLQVLNDAKAEQFALDDEARDPSRESGREALGEIIHDDKGNADRLGEARVTTQELLSLSDDEVNALMHERYGWMNDAAHDATNKAVIRAARNEARLQVRTRYAQSVTVLDGEKLTDADRDDLQKRKKEIEDANNPVERRKELEALSGTFKAQQVTLLEAGKKVFEGALSARIDGEGAQLKLADANEAYRKVINGIGLAPPPTSLISTRQLQDLSFTDLRVEMRAKGYPVPANLTEDQANTFLDNLIRQAKIEGLSRSVENTVEKSEQENIDRYIEVAEPTTPPANPITPDQLAVGDEDRLLDQLHTEYGWDPAADESNKIALRKAQAEAQKRLRIRYAASLRVNIQDTEERGKIATKRQERIKEIAEGSTPRGKVLAQMLDNLGPAAGEAKFIVGENLERYTDTTIISAADKGTRYSDAELNSGAEKGALEWVSLVFGCGGKEGADRQSCMSGALSVTSMDKVASLLSEGIGLRNTAKDYYTTMADLLPAMKTSLGSDRSSSDVYKGINRVIQGFIEAQ